MSRQISVNEVDECDNIIFVVGQTDADESNFISKAADKDHLSGTYKTSLGKGAPQLVKCSRNEHQAILANTRVDDLGGHNLNDWLQSLRARKITISGIVYLGSSASWLKSPSHVRIETLAFDESTESAWSILGEFRRELNPVGQGGPTAGPLVEDVAVGARNRTGISSPQISAEDLTTNGVSEVPRAYGSMNDITVIRLVTGARFLIELEIVEFDGSMESGWEIIQALKRQGRKRAGSRNVEDHSMALSPPQEEAVRNVQDGQNLSTNPLKRISMQKLYSIIHFLAPTMPKTLIYKVLEQYANASNAYRGWDFEKIGGVMRLHDHDPLDANDTIIAVMGPTGSGKSTFIQTVAGDRYDNHEVGHQLRSATSEVSALRFTFTDTDKSLVLVDTPGFNDTYRSDYDILETIVQWLKDRSKGQPTTHGRLARISGIVYLHRISDTRMTNSAKKNFDLFQKLCGKDFYDRVTLITTMWPEENDPFYEFEKPDCEFREQSLTGKYWKSLIDSGSKVERFTGTRKSAQDIVNAVTAYEEGKRLLHRLVQIELETVYQSKKISKTQAGQHLYGMVDEIIDQHSRTLKQLRLELARPGRDPETIEELLNELDDLQREREMAMVQKRKLGRGRLWPILTPKRKPRPDR